MPDVLRLPSARMAAFRAAHPEVDIPPPVGGVWRAHITLGPNSERVLAGRTQAELLDRLDAAMDAGPPAAGG